MESHGGAKMASAVEWEDLGLQMCAKGGAAGEGPGLTLAAKNDIEAEGLLGEGWTFVTDVIRRVAQILSSPCCADDSRACQLL